MESGVDVKLSGNPGHLGHEVMKTWPDESVRCGLGARCLSAKEVEVEVEAEVGAQARGRAWQEGEGRYGEATAGYEWQEVEGVGGAMKGKRKVKVGIGGWVTGWDIQGDAKGSSPKRRRTATAQDPSEARSWCGWCERVVLGSRDEMEMEMMMTTTTTTTKMEGTRDETPSPWRE